ncbi:serine/threonine protein kinase [Luteimonas sp. 8-5]|uniref:serine/threonine protein kinase n=1 Tax=Luteimonas sp. 8-5 TaxID=3039387 RepID=UPI00243739CD|nr:serine/threonine protein kinase [Luteimonas sp. 8-5]MDG6347763.1 serine/threonine protein kinase [Luteimonas sp. 8-5]
METNAMELDDLKSAWRALDARLARQDRLQLELLKERRADRARRNLRPLLVGMTLQALLGVGLVVLGVACWRQNLDVAGLFAAGVALHAFGVLHVALAGIVAALAISLDPGAPVLAIQKRLRLMLRMQVLNSNACGAPWWIMWVVVVIGFAGLSHAPAGAGTPAWVWINLAIGAVGAIATWLWSARATRKPGSLYARIDDGADGIRRNLRLFDDIEEFERG